MIRTLLVCVSLAGAFLAGLFVQPRRLRGASYAPPPRSIMICGANDYACSTYVISYHPAMHADRDLQGEGVIDYGRKTIRIVWSTDRFKNVEAVEREVFHAALRERGIHDTDKWDVHDWLHFSDRVIALLLHDSPELVNYITSGY